MMGVRIVSIRTIIASITRSSFCIKSIRSSDLRAAFFAIVYGRKMISWEIRWRSVCRLEHRSRLYNTGTETYTDTTLYCSTLMLTLLLLCSGVVIRETYLQVDKTDSCTSSIYSCRVLKFYLYLQSSGILTKSTSSSNEAYSEQTTRFLLFKDYAIRHKVSITTGLRRFHYLISLYPSLNIKFRDGVHMRPPSCPSSWSSSQFYLFQKNFLIFISQN